jgi:hypothetical protein
MGLLNNINNFFVLLYQNINCYYICYNNKNNNSELRELLISEEKDNKYITSFEVSLVQPNSSEYYLF